MEWQWVGDHGVAPQELMLGEMVAPSPATDRAERMLGQDHRGTRKPGVLIGAAKVCRQGEGKFAMPR